MRPWAHVIALAALSLAGMGLCPPAEAQTPPEAGHHFVVVTIANEPLRPAAHAGTTATRYTGDRYEVSQSALETAKRVARTHSLREVASWPIKELAVHCVVYEIPDSRTVDDVLTALTKDPAVALAEPLHSFHTLTQSLPAQSALPPSASTPTSAPPIQPPAQASPTPQAAAPAYNDPLYGLQTNLVALGISAAHERAQGAGVRVALIDTGVDRAHPDLQGRIVSTHSFLDAPGAPARGATPGAYRHGTAMAGLIAAVANNHIGIVGIAPLAQIEVFEACWQLAPDADEAACNTFTLAKALAAALERHVPLVNLSIAGPPDPLLSALVRSGLQHGVIFVGSMPEAAAAFPTDVEGVIGVGNSEREHAGATLAAPATHVLTLRPRGEYDFVSGTSVAAAEMTGVIALLLSINSHLTADAAITLLKDTVSSAHRPQSRETVADQASIDVGAALARLDAGRSGGRIATSPNAR